MKLKRLIFFVLIVAPLATSLWAKTTQSIENENKMRMLASLMEPPVLIYTTYQGSNNRPKVEEIDLKGWQEILSDGGRYDRLVKMYYANTRAKSHTGLKHTACFLGNAQELRDSFFGEESPKNNIRFLKKRPFVRASSDGQMLGIEFTAHLNPASPNKGKYYHFRLPSCSSGKDSLYQSVGSAVKERTITSDNFPPVLTDKPDHDGLEILDQVKGDTTGLSRFVLKADYNLAVMAKNDRPWQGMDIRTAKGAMEFALMLQNYVYEGMTDQGPLPDQQFYVEHNQKRYWCHMPWLNVGNAGRESIHGLTNERPLKPSPIYPKATKGSNWGVAYFNGAGCQTIGRVFGSRGALKETPDFSNVEFEEGTVAAKMLFTTAKFDDLKGAYTWKANVSEPYQNNRMLKEVSHLQMDIAVKDSSLIGTTADTGHWVMITYYYDLTYESPLAANLPQGLRRMRPAGVQVGFEDPTNHQILAPNASLIFEGAKTNQVGQRLNGPADNPKSSCLGCHGVAGTNIPVAPGFLHADQYLEYKKRGVTLDFCQQLRLAKENYETRPAGP